MGTLINPSRPTTQDEKDFTAEPVYLRNPQTGIIFKLYHIDTIKRCQQENYLPSSEAAMLEQAREMYEVQRRDWSRSSLAQAEAEAAKVQAAAQAEPVDTDEPDASATFHERNRRAALRK
jgi:hypothetical protein